MKMKDQLDSPEALKKHKAKSKKSGLKKKKQMKMESKKQVKGKKKPVVSKAPLLEQNEATKKVDTGTLKAANTSTLKTVKEAPQNRPVRRASTNRAVATPLATNSRQRVSKSLSALPKTEQRLAIQSIVKDLLLGNLTQGEALRELRVKVLGLRQEAYSELTGVSRKTLSEIENNKGNYTADIVNKIFKPFSLQVSLVPTSSKMLKDIVN